MIFGNPVRGVVHPPTWKRPTGNHDFRLTHDFGPSSNVREPKVTWPGGEGIAPAFYAHFHPAIDLGNGRAGDPVLAAQAGRVVTAGKDVDGAIRVVIDHGGGWSSGYWHLREEIVTVGQTVAKGAVIGYVGATGNVTGAHLHFFVRQDRPDLAGLVERVDPWRRLAQNVTVRVKRDGTNIRSSAGSGTTPGPIFASTGDDGQIHRKSDGADLGPFSQPRKWGGTVTGAAWEVTLDGKKYTGKTWEKIDLDGGWRYAATPLVVLSAT